MIFIRPDANYIAQPLPNSQRFTLLGKKPPTAQSIDLELNALTDAANKLQTQITGLVVGTLPGVTDLANNNKFASSVNKQFQWGGVETQNIAIGAVETDQLGNGAITTPKLGQGAVTADKIFPQSVAALAVQDASLPLAKLSAITPGSAVVSGADGAPHALQATLNQVLIGQGNATPSFELLNDTNIEPLGIGTPSLNDRCVTTGKIDDAAVTTAKINDEAVTSTKLADSSVGTPALINGSITANKLDPIVARGITVAAGTFKFSDQVIDISRCFGVSSILYINSANYAHFRVTYEGVYTNPPIVTATSFFVVNLAPVSAPIGISSAGNQSCIIAVGSQNSSALNNPNAFISFQVISRG